MITVRTISKHIFKGKLNETGDIYHVSESEFELVKKYVVMHELPKKLKTKKS
jgi:hypothetical protein